MSHEKKKKIQKRRFTLNISNGNWFIEQDIGIIQGFIIHTKSSLACLKSVRNF